MADLWICCHRKRNVGTVIDEADLDLLVEAGVTYLSINLTSGYNRARREKHYVTAEGPGVRTYLHRLLMGLAKDNPLQVDHRDGDPLNNRRSNLRVVTQAQNAQNVPRHPLDHARSVGVRSRYRNVYWSRDVGRWRVFVTGVHGGFFDDEDEAGAVAVTLRAERLPYALT